MTHRLVEEETRHYRETSDRTRAAGFTLVEVLIGAAIVVGVALFIGVIWWGFSRVAPTTPPAPTPVQLGTATGVFVSGPWAGSGTGTLTRTSQRVTFSLTDGAGAGILGETVNFSLSCTQSTFTNATSGPTGTTAQNGIAATSIRALPNQTAGGCIINASVTMQTPSGQVTGREDSPPFEVDGTSN